jgi:phospholipid/cholesterol/gamma-HCH transport system permease protein
VETHTRIQTTRSAGGEIALSLRGRLDRKRSGRLWADLLYFLHREAPTRLVCDLQAVESIDTAGIALLRSLKQRCQDQGIELDFANLPEIARRFLQREQTHEEESAVEDKPGWVSRVGGWGRGGVEPAIDLIRFLGEVAVAGIKVLRRPADLRSREFLQHLQEVGVNAVLLICVLNAMTGLIVVFQGISLVSDFGADIYVADMVVRSVAGQMAPVLTAIIIAGRSGAAFAANIGTMKIRQEIDILSVLNFNTAAFLVLPRVLAVAVATPLLIMLADASGIFGGMITSKVVLDIPMPSYIAQVHSTLEAKTIYSCLIRGAAFGIIIGLTGCFQGLRTENSADSVGVRATRATVSSIILVILADTIFAVLFNSLGW